MSTQADEAMPSGPQDQGTTSTTASGVPASTATPRQDNVPIPNILWTSPVHGAIILTAAALSVARFLGADVSWAYEDSGVWEGQFWRFLTACFLHVNAIHLLACLYWLIVWGPAIEAWLGKWRTVLLFVFLGAGSSAADFLPWGVGGIGLSGVLYGYFGLLVATRDRPVGPKLRISSGIIQLFVGWFFFCIFTTVADIMIVGNVAHGAGAVLGYLLGRAVNCRRRRGLYVSLLGGAVAATVIATLHMPWSYLWWWHRAWRATGQENAQAALAAYVQAINRAPNDVKVAALFLQTGHEAFQMGDLDLAREFYTRGQAVVPNPHLLQAYVAYTYWWARDLGAAAEASRGVSPADLDEFLSGVDGFARFIKHQPGLPVESESSGKSAAAATSMAPSESARPAESVDTTTVNDRDNRPHGEP